MKGRVRSAAEDRSVSQEKARRARVVAHKGRRRDG
ncbi:hypothetical protein Pla86_17590 [Planctomycetes bacterium Pla86]|uniref:Uncharacterized protein n=1 Tax=Engelhardtia mirabilis TaxID=2528011 RepID=A0A518BI94_9BACT|nr:hypothetical protein Pla133_17600 [Planctomycetes bacterium Pla133]QDV01010.1 hypothetical protein Pla86_17590 [Planctomycetes bacterium Pla86]